MNNFLKIISVIIIMTLFYSCNKAGSNEADLRLIPVQSGKYWGFINHEGKYIINPQFYFAQPFYCGLALVQVEDNSAGYLDYKYGYINMEGKYIINPIYKSATDFVNGRALVTKRFSNVEIIDTKGDSITTLDESIGEAYKFNDGLSKIFIVDKSSSYGYINENGKIVIPAKYADALDFNEGLALVSDNAEGDRFSSRGNDKSWGYINKSGEVVINYQFKEASAFYEGLAIASIDTKFGFIGKDGKFKINPQFDLVTQFSGGLAAFYQGSLWGFINRTGEIVINPQFKKVGLFDNNELAPACSVDGKYGFINKKGTYEIQPQFDDASQFFGDIAIISIGDKYGLINKKGEITVNPQFDFILPSSIEKTSKASVY